MRTPRRWQRTRYFGHLCSGNWPALASVRPHNWTTISIGGTVGPTLICCWDRSVTLPYRARLSDQVQLIGACDYGLPDTPKGHYLSWFVTRDKEPQDPTDFATRRFAYNEMLSHSGYGTAQ
jgi:hypothetical protein